MLKAPVDGHHQVDAGIKVVHIETVVRKYLNSDCTPALPGVFEGLC